MENESSSYAASSLSFAFDHRGHRMDGEIDLDNREQPKTIADMTAADWAEAEELYRRWRAGWRP